MFHDIEITDFKKYVSQINKKIKFSCPFAASKKALLFFQGVLC